MSTSRRNGRSRLARFMGLGAALAACVMVLSACGSLTPGGGGSKSVTNKTGKSTTTFAPDSSMALIKARGRLIVGTRLDAPPFAYRDPNLGTPVGFDVEVAKSIAAAIFGTADLEGKITWVELDPNSYEVALQQDRVDMVVGRYAISPSRKRLVDFAGPYFRADQKLLVDSDVAQQAGVDSITSLNGRVVCATSGSDTAALLKLAPNAQLQEKRSSVAECGANLLAGNSSAVLADATDEAPLLADNKRFQQLDAVVSSQVYGIGVKKGNSAFRKFLNDQIPDLKYSDIYRTQIGDAQPPEPPAVDRY